MLLCEYVLNSVRSPPSEEVIYHTLLQLYLQPRLADESDASPDAIAASQSARRWGKPEQTLCSATLLLLVHGLISLLHSVCSAPLCCVAQYSIE